jgi:hypothetical protein
MNTVTEHYEKRIPRPVSDVFEESTSVSPDTATSLAGADDERPPLCPSCNKRLVILSTQFSRDESGASVRQQLWGCPRGHATATRRAGSFSPVTLLAELVV